MESKYLESLKDKYPPMMGFSDMKPKFVPAAPEELTKFRTLNKYDRLKDGERFFKQAYMQKYLEDKWKIELYNRDCYFRLKELQKIAISDTDKQAIAVKISEFVSAMRQAKDVYEAIYINLSKEPHTDQQINHHEQQAEWDD